MTANLNKSMKFGSSNKVKYLTSTKYFYKNDLENNIFNTVTLLRRTTVNRGNTDSTKSKFFESLNSKQEEEANLFFLWKWTNMLVQRRCTRNDRIMNATLRNCTSTIIDAVSISDKIINLIWSNWGIHKVIKDNVFLCTGKVIRKMSDCRISLERWILNYSVLNSLFLIKQILYNKYKKIGSFFKKHSFSMGSMYLRNISNNLFITFVIGSNIVYTLSYKEVTRRVFNKKTSNKKKFYYFFGHVMKWNRYVLRKFNFTYLTVYFNCKPNVLSKVCNNLRWNKDKKQKFAFSLRDKLVRWYATSPISSNIYLNQLIRKNWKSPNEFSTKSPNKSRYNKIGQYRKTRVHDNSVLLRKKDNFVNNLLRKKARFVAYTRTKKVNKSSRYSRYIKKSLLKKAKYSSKNTYSKKRKPVKNSFLGKIRMNKKVLYSKIKPKSRRSYKKKIYSSFWKKRKWSSKRSIQNNLQWDAAIEKKKKLNWLSSESLMFRYNRNKRRYNKLRNKYLDKLRFAMVNHIYINIFTKAYNGSKNKKNYRYA